jgi:hypothetical protein
MHYVTRLEGEGEALAQKPRRHTTPNEGGGGNHPFRLILMFFASFCFMPSIVALILIIFQCNLLNDVTLTNLIKEGPPI